MENTEKECNEFTVIPHRGALSRIHIDIDNKDTSISYNQPTTYIYAINILSEFTTATPRNENVQNNETISSTCQYQLQYHPDHYKFMQDLFIVLDTDSRGYVTKSQLEEFVLLRCPVFKRRDSTIQEFEQSVKKNENVHERKEDDQCDRDCSMSEGISNKEEYEDDEEQLEESKVSIEKQDEQDIFNCILGEDFHSASYHELSCDGSNDQDEEANFGENEEEEEEDEMPPFRGDEAEEVDNSTQNISTVTNIQEVEKSTGTVDYDLHLGRNMEHVKEKVLSQTFEEIWNAVIKCRLNQEEIHVGGQTITSFGIEAWMVFCRFIALAQYQDADRRFSARHLQQLIEPQKNSDTNEVIIVDVPPLERPEQISAQKLIEYELLTLKSEINTHVGNIGIALPELDLDHSHLLLHDGPKHAFKSTQKVNVSVFGQNSPSTIHSLDSLEFVIRLTTSGNNQSGTDMNTKETAIVRRSYADVSWLHDAFKSQKHVSGTLCGRIIPPFPSPLGYSKANDSNDDKSLSSSAAMSVASESAVLVSSAAKSFLGQLSKSASKLKAVTKSTLKSSDKKIYHTNQSSHSVPSSTSNRQHGTSTIRKRHTKVKELILDNPSSKAKQLEQYLNYMLDHPAMSTSFPLNVILRSSQAGVQSAMRILEKYKEQNKYNPKDHKFTFERYGITSDLSWVRTAAQAALALKLHGILENTGYQSTSTKLHHASLPKFSKLRDESIGVEESANHARKKVGISEADDDDGDFEKGIICIESCLDEERDYENKCGTGFDVLPLPVPLHKRSALCAGSSQVTPSNAQFDDLSYNEIGTSYGDNFTINEQSSVTVGDVSVERDIIRLRDMMRSVDNSLKRGFSAGLLIGAESSEKMNYQVELLKEIDFGDGSCSRLISQNALLNGVESLERNRSALNSCTELFINDFCWNSALASCAVAASDEVREAVTASQTAQRAKHVAEAAAKNAEYFCSTSSFPSADEKMQSMTHASDLRSQAIHAAVVDHEALTAKRRAAVALARDVKCWNVHRKQELIKTCISTVKSYQKIASDSMSTWKRIEQNLLESQSVSNIVQSVTVKQQSNSTTHLSGQGELNVAAKSDAHFSDGNLVDSTVMTNIGSESFTQSDSISFLQSDVIESHHLDNVGEADHSPREGLEENLNFSLASDTVESVKTPEIVQRSFIESDSTAMLQVNVLENCHYDNVDNNVGAASQGDLDENSKNSHSSNHFDIDSSFHDTFQEKIPSEGDLRTKEISQGKSFPDPSPDVISATLEGIDRNAERVVDAEDEVITSFQSDFDSKSNPENITCDKEEEDNGTDNGMTDSMQSLVDGLMNWGGQWDEEEDITPLPDGMAASLLEGSGVLKSQ